MNGSVKILINELIIHISSKRSGLMNDLVILKGNEPVCDSLEVAEKFHKRHIDIIRSLENLITQNCTVKCMFHTSNYKANNGQTYKKYHMNRDGFSLLVMGFTGKEALNWKLKYIQAFNEMEKFIIERHSNEWLETRKQTKSTRLTESDTIRKFVNYAMNQGSGHPERYYILFSSLANRIVGINKRDLATTMQLNNLNLVEMIIQQTVNNDMKAGLPYKTIYDNCKKNLKIFSNLVYENSVEKQL